jgi:hypothetical protein
MRVGTRNRSDQFDAVLHSLVALSFSFRELHVEDAE